jgi:hypothetical protein
MADNEGALVRASSSSFVKVLRECGCKTRTRDENKHCVKKNGVQNMQAPDLPSAGVITAQSRL